MKTWLMRRWLSLLDPVYPQSFLCIRCRDAGVSAEADPASPDSCRGHLAEDRVNELIDQSGAWWA